MAASARGTRSLPLLIGVAVVVFVLDQLTKTWAVNRLSDGDIEVIFPQEFASGEVVFPMPSA